MLGLVCVRQLLLKWPAKVLPGDIPPHNNVRYWRKVDAGDKFLCISTYTGLLIIQNREQSCGYPPGDLT